MSDFIASIRAEFVRYKLLGERAIDQAEDAALVEKLGAESNSLATIVWHVGGNLRSRFTDFLTTDGEKPWRNREEEFDDRIVGRAELLAHWERGWSALLATLDELTNDQWNATVTIRGQPLLVHEALHRALAHVCYHVGQIVLLCKGLRNTPFESLSVPRGGTAAYNANPTHERAARHAETLRRKEETDDRRC